MPGNLPLRSASISAPDDHTLLNTGSNTSSIGATSTALRSTSIGSNFFNKDSSNFFNQNEVSNTSSNSIDEDMPANIASRSAGTDLDLVGAIGNLDLYDDLGLSKNDQNNDRKLSTAPEHDIRVENKTPFQQQMFYGENYNLYSYQPQNQSSMAASMTPNPAVGSTFGTSSITQNSTPGTWNNNFIPASAPPFGYNVGSKANELPISIRPFQLPEDNNSGTESELFFSNNQLKFGGVLDSQIHIGGPKHPMMPTSNNNGSSPDTDIDSSDIVSSQIPLGANVAPGIELMSMSDRDIKSRLDPIPSNDLMGGQFINENLSMPLNMNNIHLAPNMWNQHPIMASQMHHNLNNTYIDRPTSQHNNMGNHNGSRFNHRNRNYANDGANVHRKMHGSRKKGEDASKYANAKLEDFTGEIYSLCKDQHGCRFLQRQLDLGREVSEGKIQSTTLTNDIAATMIFNEIYLKIVELMTDPFGNYLIQKLFENVSTDQRIILVKNSAPEFIRIALNPHGTRALQKLVECITTEEESKLIIDSLSSHIVSLSRDLNGNHVVQKCLQKLRPDENQFIFDTASAHCREIATHRHGCCVLQRCLDHGNEKQRQQLSHEVAQNATKLSLDPFGNYVVQYVLSRGDEDSIEIILNHIKSNIVELSLHKFGSNVIEKSLRINKLTDTLIEVLLLNKERFSDLLNDAFGNYVLQTALDVANPTDLSKLSQSLQPLLPNIKNTPHGRRIMTKIQSM